MYNRERWVYIERRSLFFYSLYDSNFLIFTFLFVRSSDSFLFNSTACRFYSTFFFFFFFFFFCSTLTQRNLVFMFYKQWIRTSTRLSWIFEKEKPFQPYWIILAAVLEIYIWISVLRYERFDWIESVVSELK